MNPWSGLKGLRREVWVLFAAALVNRAGTMALPFLVLFLTRAREWPAERAGLALTAFGLGSLLTAPLSGRLADRIGAGRVLKASLLLCGLLMVLVPHVQGTSATLALIFVWAVVGDAYRPANMALLSHLSDPEQRKSAFALNRLALNLGMSIGPALGGFLAAYSYEALFWVDGATSFLAGLVALFFLGPGGPAERAADGTAGPQPPSALRDGRFLAFMALLLPVGLVFFQLSGALPLFVVRDLALGEAAFGILFTVNTVLIVVLEIPLTGLTARWPHGVTLPLGATLVGIGFAAMALATGFWTAAATVLVWTFGEMVLFPASNAAVSDLAPPQRQGEYMGIYSATFSLALAAGPYFGTALLEARGPVVLWILCGLLSLLSAVGMGLLWRKREAGE